MAVAAFLLAAPKVWSQNPGQADVAFQGYYLAGSGQPQTEIIGPAVSTSEFIPGVGLFTANVEGYGGNSLHTGNMFAGLERVPLWGWHWDFLGGDFHFASTLVKNPFDNIYMPEIAARGLDLAVRRTNRSYRFFVGEETVLAGLRIPYRVTMPQRVLGATVQQQVGKRLQLALRFLNLSTNPDALTSDQVLLLPGHEFRTSNSLTFESAYSPSKHLTLYAEAGYGTASSLPPEAENPSPTLAGGVPQPFSLLVGPSWEGDKFSFQANYVRQSTTYLPLLGTYAGDRQGPFAEGHFRPLKRLDFFASASAYSNNLEHNQELPTFHSSAYTAGASVILPWKFDASASLSTLLLTERDPSLPSGYYSNNRQLSFDLTRPIRRHTLRFSLIDMKLNNNLAPMAERFSTVEDNFTWKRLVLGGAVRLQSSQSTQSKNTIFFRGSIQANFKRLSAYAYLEKGNDLVNRSVFSTSAYNSSVAGLAAPLLWGWNFQAETFRYALNTALNPENVFLFPASELGMNTQLAGFNQWSVYARLSKHFHWGRELPRGGDLEQYAAAHSPLVGSIQGFVMERSLTGSRPAAGVAVSLAHFRTALTDSSGHYQFASVPEGSYEVGLDADQLPTDYDPGPVQRARVNVEPRAIARADFSVYRLTYIAGRVVGLAGPPLENVLIRLAGTNRYTTPHQDGRFAFYNLREGEYEVVLDEHTVPEGYLLASSIRVRVLASQANAPTAVIEFKLQPEPVQQKPIREILHEQIQMKLGGSAGRGGTLAGEGGNP